MTPAIFGLSGTVLTGDERAFFRDADPAGYILFARNCENAAQMRALTDELRAIAGRANLLITVDQEGGRVARMKPPVWPKYPPQGVFDRLYDIAPISAIEAAQVNAEAIGLDLAEAGLNCDALPLLDVRCAGAHDVIGDRALGHDPMRVAALGRAVLEGLEAAGVAGIVKHIPGHGRACADSHREMPVVTASEAELEQDIAPFRALRDAAMGMSAHVKYTAWDAENPATQSARIIGDIIRGRIGFDGLLMSDDIDMEALSGSIADRSVRALQAGCDLVLNCWAKMPDMIATVEACGEIAPDARRRLDAAMAGKDVGPFGGAERRVECIAKRDGLLMAAGVEA